MIRFSKVIRFSKDHSTEWSDFQKWSDSSPHTNHTNLLVPQPLETWFTKPLAHKILFSIPLESGIYTSISFLLKVSCFAELCKKSFEECLCRFIERWHWSERREKRRRWRKRKKRRWNHDLLTFKIGGILYAGLMQKIYSPFQEEDAASPVKSVLASFGTQVSSIWDKYL